MRRATVIIGLALGLAWLPPVAHAQRQMEALGRGVVAVHPSEGTVYVGWRLLGTDPESIAFNLYRSTGPGAPVRLNPEPLTASTNWVDTQADLTQASTYSVRAVLDGREQPASAGFALPAQPPVRNYLAVKLGGHYGFNRASVGDLDGDGEFEIVIKQPDQVSDPGKYSRSTDTWKLEAYRLDGRRLWSRDLGWNVEQGVWWSPFLVYDLDGDGRAEVVAKTAPTDTDLRGPDGRVATGPEWFTVFAGPTGKELAKADWIPRGELRDWGDTYGNRVNRNLMCVAYLDGTRPSLVICRGLYGLMKVEAWNYRAGTLTRLWQWSNQTLGPQFQAQGFHGLHAVDLDGDGRDEILHGALALDDNGTTHYSTGEGHGDRFHVTDIDPARPGLEVWYCHETKHGRGVELTDARSGQRLFGPPSPTTGDVGRALVADLDPRHSGLECWAGGGGAQWLFSARGEVLATAPQVKLPPCQFAIWWDDDLLRELVEDGRIWEWDWERQRAEVIGTHVLTRYSDKLVADVVGDWREEVVTVAAGELRIYTTPIPSTRRLATLMHDPLYRNDVACMGMGYTQSAHPSFFLGDSMAPPPRRAITTPAASTP